MRYRKPNDYENKLNQLMEKKILCTDYEELSFDKNQKLYIEIGMGRGDFLTEHAKRFSDHNYLGIERQAPLLVLAGQKILENNLPNIRLMNVNAMQLEEILPKESCCGIFLNFSDPWSKPRYRKRRLTHFEMLHRYENVLKKGGILNIKTDNRDFFKFSLSQLALSRFGIVRVIEGLHDEENRKFFEEDPILIMTEYEKKFVSLQKTIFAIECILI